MDAKIEFLGHFLSMFFRMRFDIDFDWIFGGSKPQKSLFFQRKINDFHEIDVFAKVPKNR